MCEERMAQLMIQLDVLEYLHDNNLPLDVSLCHRISSVLYLFIDIVHPEAPTATRGCRVPLQKH